MRNSSWRSGLKAVAWGAVCLLAVGCEAPPPQFKMNLLEIERQEQLIGEPITEDQRLQLADLLTELFGTPDDPTSTWGGDTAEPLDEDVERESAAAEPPFNVLAEQGFDIELLKLAAGPVGRDHDGKNRGLYRLHCAHCHGITGDGVGPTAEFLNPYPRDFRQGVFKFKSTVKPAKPTRDDLHRVLVDGVPGTAMPSFKLLPAEELAALVEYVIYLSTRGETEIRLLTYIGEEGEVPEEPEIVVGEVVDGDEDVEFENILAGVVYQWRTEDQHIIQPVTPPNVAAPAAWAASVARGRELYFGVGNCASCHGALAIGDGQLDAFDVWNEQTQPEHLALGALPQRTIAPRNLRSGVYRGGRRPIDLYRRIFTGINGTPMPGVPLTDDPEDSNAMTAEDVWHLVNFVKSLPLDPLSLPPELQTAPGRDRL